jgi:Domain of unknown function (DUF4129)
MGVAGVRAATVVIVLTTLIGVVAGSGDGPIRERPAPDAPGPAPREPALLAVVSREGSVPAWLLWVLGIFTVAVVVFLVVCIARGVIRMSLRLPRLGGLRWRRRARKPRATGPPRIVPGDEPEVAREAVDAALASLLRDATDPRAAVIEAYVRMERVLAERELGRRTPEAPREYLGRVMREQGMPEASLTTLTALFEEARFSRHPIPESAPRRAARELQNARAALSR